MIRVQAVVLTHYQISHTKNDKERGSDMVSYCRHCADLKRSDPQGGLCKWCQNKELARVMARSVDLPPPTFLDKTIEWAIRFFSPAKRKLK